MKEYHLAGAGPKAFLLWHLSFGTTFSQNLDWPSLQEGHEDIDFATVLSIPAMVGNVYSACVELTQGWNATHHYCFLSDY